MNGEARGDTCEGGEGEIGIAGAHVDGACGGDIEGPQGFGNGAAGAQRARGECHTGAVIHGIRCSDGEIASAHGDARGGLESVCDVELQCASGNAGGARLCVGLAENDRAAGNDQAAGIRETTGEGDGAAVACEGGVAVQVVVIKERGGPGTAQTDRAGGTAGIGRYIDRGVVGDTSEQVDGDIVALRDIADIEAEVDRAIESAGVCAVCSGVGEEERAFADLDLACVGAGGVETERAGTGFAELGAGVATCGLLDRSGEGEGLARGDIDDTSGGGVLDRDVASVRGRTASDGESGGGGGITDLEGAGGQVRVGGNAKSAAAQEDETGQSGVIGARKGEHPTWIDKERSIAGRLGGRNRSTDSGIACSTEVETVVTDADGASKSESSGI